ncbi:GNAT family N-acetyltransferase [Actinoallomurus sp. WRP6H-15]|nr:GNAT family N-acetyltransferase [Actinoallomurus soli]MCO5970409.1 GNAT family N-acetyltransferase [Actinoallomurus soli]
MTKLIPRSAPLRLAGGALPVAGARPDEGSMPVVGVRPYEDGDREGVLGMRLSTLSLYRRFFAGTPRIPAFYAETLSRVDHWDRDALVAVAGTEIAGIAEYTRDATLPGLADLAVMVADPWQRRGVGRRLVTGLTRLARARGIGELRADVLVDNHAARAAIGGLWPHAAAAHGEDGALIYRITLQDG